MWRLAILNDSGEALKLDGVTEAVTELCARYGIAGELNVRLVTDEEMSRLNERFRGIAGPTDVLTFPAPESAVGQAGDIAVSVGFARRQAEARRVPVEDEVAMLAVHGGLHLAGFEDESDEGREDMVRRMNEVAAACGLTTDAAWSSLPHGGPS
jgi:rRNA maturation RNase YbeY